MLRTAFLISTAAFLSLSWAAPAPALAPTVQNVTECVARGWSVAQPPNSVLRACCIEEPAFDDPEFKGCFICDADWSNCVWEPGFRQVHIGIRPALQGQTLDPGVNPQQPRPHFERPVGGGVFAPSP